MDASTLISLLTVLATGGVLAEAVRSLVQRKKMSADVAQGLTETAMTLLKPLRERIQELEQELTDTQQVLADTKVELLAARSEVRMLRAESRAERARLHREIGDSGELPAIDTPDLT